MMNNPTVFLLPLNKSSLNELAILAHAIQQDGHYTPIMITVPKIMDMAHQILNNIHILDYAALTVAKPKAVMNRFFRRMPYCEEFVVFREKITEDLAKAQQLFETYQPQALITVGDRHPLPEPTLIKIAKERGCPVIIVPYAATSPYFTAELRSHKPLHHLDQPPQRKLKWLIKHRYPKQIFASEHGELLYFSPIQTLAMASQNILPTHSWVMGANQSDYVCVIDEKTKQEFISFGVPPDKIRISGLPSHDDLFQAAQDRDQLKNKVIQQYNLDPAKKIMLWSVPQLGEHNILDWDSHWQEIHFVAQVLSQLDCTVLASLHPKSEPAQYQFLQHDYQIPVLTETLRTTLPAADLFTAVNSGTIEWAIMLKIPTLHYNFYGLDDRRLHPLASVIRVYAKDNLLPTYQQLVANPDGLVAALEKDARHMAPLDGQTCQRIINIIGRKV